MHTTSTASSPDSMLDDDRAAAESSFKALHQADLERQQVTIIGKGYYTAENARGLHSEGDRDRRWGDIGGCGDLLAKPAVLLVPCAAGPFGLALAALESAVIADGLSAPGLKAVPAACLATPAEIAPGVVFLAD